MRSSAGRSIGLLAATALVGAPGCQTAGGRFLSLIGLQKEPLALAVLVEPGPAGAVQSLNPFTPYAGLQGALRDALGRPISVDLCFPFQGEGGLHSGWYDLAVVTPAQFARLESRERLPVLAVALDEQGRAAQPALLIVPAASPTRGIADLRGKVVAFGPAEDSRTHHAALQLLERAGLARTDLQLSPVPLPGSLKHFPNMRAVAQSVLAGSSDAGFITQAAWDALPERDARPGEPARAALRVLAATAALPDRLVVGSPKLDAPTADQVRAALLAVGRTRPEAVAPLGSAGFVEPEPELLAACRALAVGAAGPADKPGTPPGP